jgi:hypothetical protein
MPLGLSFKQNSLYNYGGISPNNLVSYISTYNPVYYSNTGGYFGTGSTVYDLTVNKNNFTLNNTYSYSGGISFPGTNGYLVSGDLINYFPSFNSQTQEIWFKNAYYNESGTNGVLLNEWGTSTPNTLPWYYSQIEFIGQTGYIGVWNGLINKIPVGKFIDGNWHCISWKYDGSTLHGYVDGIKTNTLSSGRTTPPNFYVGIAATDATNMGNGNYFKGLVGSYRLYNRSLTDSEILQNYNYEKQFFVRTVRVNVIGPGETASWYSDVITKITTAKNSLYPGYTLTITQNNSTSYLGSDLLTSNFDTVFIWTDAAYNTTLGTNLNSFVTAGGGIVICTFANASIAITNFAYTNSPIVYPGNQSAGGNLTLGTYTSSDPLMNGVTSFNIGSAGFGASGITLQAGATSVASYSNGTNLVAKKTIGSARTVSLNFFPPSTTARSDFWNASTNGDRLMTNAIMWSGKGV